MAEAVEERGTSEAPVKIKTIIQEVGLCQEEMEADLPAGQPDGGEG